MGDDVSAVRIDRAPPMPVELSIKCVTLTLSFEQAQLIRDLLGACPEEITDDTLFWQLCRSAPELYNPKPGRTISLIKAAL